MWMMEVFRRVDDGVGVREWWEVCGVTYLNYYHVILFKLIL